MPRTDLDQRRERTVVTRNDNPRDERPSADTITVPAI